MVPGGERQNVSQNVVFSLRDGTSLLQIREQKNWNQVSHLVSKSLPRSVISLISYLGWFPTQLTGNLCASLSLKTPPGDPHLKPVLATLCKVPLQMQPKVSNASLSLHFVCLACSDSTESCIYTAEGRLGPGQLLEQQIWNLWVYPKTPIMQTEVRSVQYKENPHLY